MSTVQDIKSLDEWSSHLASLSPGTLLIVNFYAPWAAPCAQMATVLSTLAAEYPPSTTSWVSINAEELSDLSEKYGIVSVPFLVLIRDGSVVQTVSGNSALKVRTAIEKHTSSPTAAPSAIEQTSAAQQQPEVEQQAEPAEEETDPEKKKAELRKRLENLVRAAPVMLFMKGTPSAPQCGFSRQLVAILRENSVRYGFFNILADDEVRQGLKEYADWPTYPQLWIDGELVGGLDIIKEELASDPAFFKPYAVSKANGDAGVAA